MIRRSKSDRYTPGHQSFSFSFFLPLHFYRIFFFFAVLFIVFDFRSILDKELNRVKD